MTFQVRYLTSKRKSLFLLWFTVALYAVVHMTKCCFGAAMSAIVEEGIMTKAETGQITALFYLVYAPLQIVGGKLADKYDPSKIILIGLLGSSAVNFLIFFNQSYYYMLVIWTLGAILQFGVWPAVFKIASSLLHPCHREEGIFFLTISITAGLFLSYASAALISVWQYNFLLSACLLLLFAILTALIFPRLKRDMNGQPPLVRSEDAQKAPQIRKSGIFRRSGLYLIVIAFIGCSIIEQSTKGLSPTMLMESYDNVSASFGNVLTLCIIGAGILGTILAKILHDRFLRNEIKGIFRLFLAGLPLLILLLWLGTIHTFFAVLSLSFISMLLSAAILLRSYVSAKFAKYGKDGEAAGLLNFAASVGIVLQNYVITAVAEYLGWQAVIWLWIGILVLALILILFAFPGWKKFLNKQISS